MLTEGFDFSNIKDNTNSSNDRNAKLIIKQVHQYYRKIHIQKLNELFTNYSNVKYIIKDIVLGNQHWVITHIDEYAPNTSKHPILYISQEILIYMYKNNIRFNNTIIIDKFNINIDNLILQINDIQTHGECREILFNEILNPKSYDFILHVNVNEYTCTRMGEYKYFEKLCNNIFENNGNVNLSDINLLDNDKNILNIKISDKLIIEQCIYLKTLHIDINENSKDNIQIQLDHIIGLHELYINDPAKKLKVLDVNKIPDIQTLKLPEKLNQYCILIGNEVNAYFK